MRTLFKTVTFTLAFIGLLGVATLRIVERSDYHAEDYYLEMTDRLDSLAQHLEIPKFSGSIKSGWSKVSVIPEDSEVSLAGYGARDPKTMSGILDTTYVRTIVLSDGQQKLGLVTADLLIIPPEVSRAVVAYLPPAWENDELFYTATHTHSGIGGWAPGLVGSLFAGTYDPMMIKFLAKKIAFSIIQAEENLSTYSLSFGEVVAEKSVYNRLVKEKGVTDPYLKSLKIQNQDTQAFWLSGSAHATCLDHHSHKLSADYPGQLIRLIERDSLVDFAAFGAGAVGSMGPAPLAKQPEEKMNELGFYLKKQFDLMNYQALEADPFYSFRIQLPLREPQPKISENLALRPYLFRWLFGDYQMAISVAVVGDLVMIGLPFDFSGELAVPLYQRAEVLGFRLIIHSFNGDYGGYIIKDEWYDLSKYEARTMSWYGHDAGAYLSETIYKMLTILHENQ